MEYLRRCDKRGDIYNQRILWEYVYFIRMRTALKRFIGQGSGLEVFMWMAFTSPKMKYGKSGKKTKHRNHIERHWEQKSLSEAGFVQLRHVFALICLKGEGRAIGIQVAIVLSSVLGICGGANGSTEEPQRQRVIFGTFESSRHD